MVLINLELQCHGLAIDEFFLYNVLLGFEQETELQVNLITMCLL